MHKSILAALAALSMPLIGAAAAEERATAADAEAMVKKAVVFLKANGPEKAFAEFNNRKGQFVDRDIYIVVYGLNGVVRAHGGNEKLVGKDMLDAQDTDGKFFVKERVELAKAQGTFWQDYKFSNPVSKKVEPKHMYCERVDDAAVCGGVYK
jgi:cytochrome c